MRANLAALGLSIFLSAAVCSAQNAPNNSGGIVQPGYSPVNCSGFISDQKVPDEIRVVSGEQPGYKITFARGDYVYLNRGQDKGVRVGDRFAVMRPDRDPLNVPWFKWQEKLLKAMGTIYVDAGQLRVVNVQPKVSIAEVIFSCGYMQRGDIVRPYVERPAPPFKDAATFDHFAPVSGKPVAMVVAGLDYTQLYGTGTTVYVNLGAAQNVKVGDYFRVFRYQGSLAETAPQTKDYQYKMYGFGASPTVYTWKDLPREVLGEGIVLNVSRNSSTVLLTFSSTDINAGDYVELE
ncbi:MAG TPA: hypothetical protein VOA78_02910 [Candidatus Dormibacteraeota bacterium]|nr:hypothetical protein [Candidatus Dormibacteraeota bacterium]